MCIYGGELGITILRKTYFLSFWTVFINRNQIPTSKYNFNNNIGIYFTLYILTNLKKISSRCQFTTFTRYFCEV